MANLDQNLRKIYKFDGSNPKMWVALMEEYFSLERIIDDGTKLSLGNLYLNQETWQWWQGHSKCYPKTITWSMFTKSICDGFNPKSNFLGPLTKLRPRGTQPNKDFIGTGKKETK